MQRVMAGKLSVCAMLGALVLAGCGGDDEPVNRYPSLSSASPLEVTTERLAVGVRHGEALSVSTGDAGSMVRAATVFPHAVLRVQSYDELATSFGEYTWFQVSSSQQQRQANVFLSAPAQGALDRRTDDLFGELDAALMRANASDISRRSVVVDVMRTRGDWFIRWDGVLEEGNLKGQGDYGFDRQSMVTDLLDDLKTLAAAHTPETIIVGVGMQRLIATQNGAGLSQEEFSNFALFYRRAVEVIKEASPQTRVGVDIQWDRFAQDVAPLSVRDGESDMAQVILLDRAVQRWLLPLWQDSDVIALSAEMKDDDSGTDRYQFLRRLNALYGLDKPIVFTSLRAPIDNPSLALSQRNAFDAFLQWTAGVPVEWMAFERLVNIDGTTGQTPTGRCDALLSSSRPFDLDVSRCHDGVLDALFQPKPVFVKLED